MSSSGADEKMVRLRANDGEEFEVAASVAALSQTVKFVVEDSGVGNSVIPLPKVDGKTLAKILEYCKVHAGGGGKTNAEKKEFDQKFMEVELAELYGLIIAANYLEVKELLEMLAQRVADMIKGKTSEEIRQIFNIENDLSPEEEEEIRNDNRWAF